MLFVRRDFVAIYKQTILGPLWFLLQPLFSTLIFTIIFGFIARIPTDGVPQILFYLSGIVIWQYFASCFTKTSDTFIANAGIFGKVYFPRLAIPMSVWILVTPILLLQMAALGLGFGILISSLTTRYRDFVFVVGFGVQLWMYATPIIYPMSQIPYKWQWIFSLNPVAAIVEIFRFAFLGAGTINYWQWGISLGMTLLVLVIGIILFTRIERTFVDTV
jgi:lipopolysaccharide transport system permease protein